MKNRFHYLQKNQGRKKSLIVTLLSIAFLFICSGTVAQTENQTPATAESVAQQQMLQQIQRLQKVQAEQARSMNQQPAGTDQMQGQLYSNSNVNQQGASRPRPRYYPAPKSNFEYPFPNAQVRHSGQIAALSNGAFDNAVRSTLPMSPQQIHRLKQIYNSSQFAAAMPAGVPPKPTATSLYVNLSPGATPPVIRLTEGFVTSLVFLDATGASWPIAAYDLGNPDAFNIAWDKKDNVLMIQAKTLYTYGNLAVRLRGLTTPIMLTLIPGQKIVDYRVDITVPGYGPDARQLPISTSLPPSATPVLLNVLDGIPPTGSKQLVVSEEVGEAWLLKGKVYLRTKFNLLSPGWLATMASADGTHAYELQKTPMILLAKNGKVVHIKIEGY